LNTKLNLLALTFGYANGFGWAAYDNNVDAFVPEFWAKEGIMVLEEELVAAQMVHRDFQNQIANFGDTVNTRLPSDLSAKRKTDSDDVVVQDVSATNVPVVLNQHIHTSFVIKDGQQSTSMNNLIEEYLRPAMRSLGNIIDQIVLAQFPQFLNYTTGTLGTLDSTNAKTQFLAVRGKMNQRSLPAGDRNLMLTTNAETAVLGTDLFISAEKVGDNGTALREASLGRKLGLNTFKSVFQPSLIESQTSTTAAKSGAINLTAGYAVGTTGALVVDGITGLLVVGAFIKLGGVPYRITAQSATLGNSTGMTLDRPLVNAVLNNDVFTYYAPGAVNNVAGYATGWAKEIVVDGGINIQVGQMVSFGSSAITYGTGYAGGPGGTPIYVVVQTNGSTSILLDRPLEAALANDDAVNYGPGGEYNLAFHKNSMALVIRPLAEPMAGAGARSAVADYKGIAMRVTVTYEGRSQGHLVTCDLLAGIKILDSRKGQVLLG
jgi:hypothetical protein